MNATFPYAIYSIKQDVFLDRNEISSRVMLREFNVNATPGKCTFEELISITSKLIATKVRNIFISKSLECPPEVRTGFENFKKKVVRGDNLNPHLSKRIFNPDFNDGMLIDFGVYHFHLGSGVSKDTLGNDFSERTGPVLAAFVNESSVYFIKISPHGNGLWLDKDLIEILHKEWPDTIEKYKIKNIEPISEEQDRGVLRKIRVNGFMKLSDGTSYFPTGGGMTAAGTSINSSLAMTNHNRIMFNAETILYKYLPQLDYPRLPQRKVGPVILKMLNMDGSDFYFIDKSLRNYYCYKSKDSQLVMYPLSNLNEKFKAIGGTNINTITQFLYKSFGYHRSYIMKDWF